MSGRHRKKRASDRGQRRRRAGRSSERGQEREILNLRDRQKRAELVTQTQRESEGERESAEESAESPHFELLHRIR